MPIRILIVTLSTALAGCAAVATVRDVARPAPVLFSFAAPGASSVALAGTFNRWEPAAHLLRGPDRDGVWTISVPLEPGRYEYLFLVDGATWARDPAAPAADDGMGGMNSVVVIPPP